jgi:hypothetical protein
MPGGCAGRARSRATIPAWAGLGISRRASSPAATGAAASGSAGGERPRGRRAGQAARGQGAVAPARHRRSAIGVARRGLRCTNASATALACARPGRPGRLLYCRPPRERRSQGVEGSRWASRSSKPLRGRERGRGWVRLPCTSATERVRALLVRAIPVAACAMVPRASCLTPDNAADNRSVVRVLSAPLLVTPLPRPCLAPPHSRVAASVGMGAVARSRVGQSWSAVAADFPRSLPPFLAGRSSSRAA